MTIRPPDLLLECRPSVERPGFYDLVDKTDGSIVARTHLVQVGVLFAHACTLTYQLGLVLAHFAEQRPTDEATVRVIAEAGAALIALSKDMELAAPRGPEDTLN